MFARGVDTGGVVGASVQKNDRLFWSRLNASSVTTNVGFRSRTNLQIRLKAFKVQSDGFLVEIPVTANLEPGVPEDGSVVAPRRDRKIDNF